MQGKGKNQRLIILDRNMAQCIGIESPIFRLITWLKLQRIQLYHIFFSKSLLRMIDSGKFEASCILRIIRLCMDPPIDVTILKNAGRSSQLRSFLSGFFTKTCVIVRNFLVASNSHDSHTRIQQRYFIRIFRHSNIDLRGTIWLYSVSYTHLDRRHTAP